MVRPGFRLVLLHDRETENQDRDRACRRRRAFISSILRIGGEVSKASNDIPRPAPPQQNSRSRKKDEQDRVLHRLPRQGVFGSSGRWCHCPLPAARKQEGWRRGCYVSDSNLNGGESHLRCDDAAEDSSAGTARAVRSPFPEWSRTSQCNTARDIRLGAGPRRRSGYAGSHRGGRGTCSFSGN